MRRAFSFPALCHAGAALCALSLAMTCVLPAAQAEEAAAAAAKPPDKKTKKAAREAYGAGQKAYDGGDYAAALEGFTKANELIPSPHADYWIAMSLDKLNKLEETIAAYDKLLASPDVAKIGDDKVAEVTARLKELKAKLPGEVSLVTDPVGATVLVNGTPQTGTTPMLLKLPAGPHKLSITLDGHAPQEVSIEVKGGERTEQNLQLAIEEPPLAAPPPAPAEPPPAPEPPKAEPRSMVPAYVTLGIAGAGLITGTIFGIRALGAKSDFEDNPTTDLADDVDQNALIADMSFGIALTLGVTGIVLLTSDDAETGSEEQGSKLTLTPYVGHTSGGAFARYTF